MPKVSKEVSVPEQIMARVRKRGRGWVFTPWHMVDLGPRKSVDMALSRLSEGGEIRHLGRGLYDYPKRHKKLGWISPGPDAIAQALCERDQSRFQPAGDYAMNLLGLSTQIPAHVVYLTDATTRTVKVGNQSIHLLQTTPRNMKTAETVAGLVIQAFRHLGAGKVTDEHIDTLRRKIPRGDREAVWKSHVYAPAWMRGPMLSLIQDRDGNPV